MGRVGKEQYGGMMKACSLIIDEDQGVGVAIKNPGVLTGCSVSKGTGGRPDG